MPTTRLVGNHLPQLGHAGSGTLKCATAMAATMPTGPTVPELSTHQQTDECRCHNQQDYPQQDQTLTHDRTDRPQDRQGVIGIKQTPK